MQFLYCLFTRACYQRATFSFSLRRINLYLYFDSVKITLHHNFLNYGNNEKKKKIVIFNMLLIYRVLLTFHLSKFLDSYIVSKFFDLC